jgi:hypothetical protein
VRQGNHDGRYNIVLPGTRRFRIRCERLSILLRLALAERHAARRPPSGSLRQLADAFKKRRNYKHKSKILRFIEIRSDPISTRNTRQQGAKKPEDRPRSA